MLIDDETALAVFFDVPCSASNTGSVAVFIELGNGGRDALRGIPRLAGPEHGQQILGRLAELSAALGTRIDLDPARGIGVIDVP